MDNNKYTQPEMVINIKEIIWDLLEQWKAILLFSLAMMIMVAGAKYAKDTKAYTAKEEQAAKEVSSGITAEERIGDIIDALPLDERDTVSYLVKQSEWIAAEKEYVSKSIIMNTDPTNQRTLMLDYYIKANDATESKLKTIAYGYIGYMTNDKVIESVGNAIDPNAEGRYIAELIRCDNKSDKDYDDPDDAIGIIEVRVILPEECDAKKVENAITNELTVYSKELGSVVTPHSINLFKSGESRQFNEDALNNRNTILRSINDLSNNSKNIKTSLSDDQKSALEQIEKIKSEDQLAAAGEGSSAQTEEGVSAHADKPGISKKYAVAGFILGVLLYAGAYLLLIIARGRVQSAESLEHYTDTRLLGEIYYKKEKKGWQKLLCSNLVDSFRYKNKQLDDPIEACKKTSGNISAACKHAGADEVTAFIRSENAEDLLKEINNKGIKVKTIRMEESDEEALPEVRNAIIIADENTKLSELTSTVSDCRAYDINIIGNVYLATK